MSDRTRVLVRGAGDVGSAVAVVLFRAGYAVALHDEPAPTAPRRGMAFADAVFDGRATLDGLTAVRVITSAELRDGLNAGAVLPVSTMPLGEVLDAAAWSAIVDAHAQARSAGSATRSRANDDWPRPEFRRQRDRGSRD
jgi:xanthine dehydrogenase accessory factor